MKTPNAGSSSATNSTATSTVEQLAAIIDALPIAIVMVDVEGRIALFNAQSSRLFGYSREEVLGRSVDMLVPKSLHATHSEVRSQYMKSAETRPMGKGRDLFGVRKDGTEIPIEIALNPIATSKGLFVVSAIVDLSERKRHAEALERSNRELQRFALLASHDLQTPMRSISSFVQLLESHYADRLDGRALDWIGRTQQSIKDLQLLIKDLLEYSRFDTMSRPFEPVSLRDAFDRALLMLDVEVRESGATVTSGVLPVVRGDRSQLIQLLQNLIGNALKYRGTNPPKVHVAAERTGGNWTVAVRDNGIGISPKYHEKIFEIFQRLHDSTEYPGSGIGLAVCRRIVERHGGRIWVESNAGQGSVFYFTIQEGGRPAV